MLTLLLWGCAPDAPMPIAEAVAAPMPALPQAPAVAAAPLNEAILDILSGYPLGDAIPYVWFRGHHTDGVSQPLRWQGETLAAPEAQVGVHCSGITFEVYVRAMLATEGDGRQTPDQMQALKTTWYNEDGSRGGPVDALVSQGLGEPITDLAALEPGDLVQFWRNNGNGHSAIFIEHTYWRSGAVRGMIYWSAQSASEGIGYRRISMGSRPDQFSEGGLLGVRAMAVLPQDADQHHDTEHREADADEQPEALR